MDPEKTDWTSYYSKKYQITSITREITQKHLIQLLETYKPSEEVGEEYLEIGGASSCFFNTIFNKLSPKNYTIIDNNTYGVEKFLEDNKDLGGIKAINADIFNCELANKYSIVFSIGLIEHFCKENSAKAIEAHFRMCKSGGLVIIGFPTPTTQYLFTRRLMEICKLWKFFDERPVRSSEVEPVFLKYGTILEKRLLRQLPLTQLLYAIRTN